ncbi:hypothetical protein JCGZ_20986 [Jatropha curcas]|uniref:Uncharacterized protein n=1 Tax=Jatropha curcas TaxID=180498 RepID=A0A067JSW7_JATCU|nr:hypothetical protein JCGZ_20986 [Jatropha curcas]
MATAAARMMLSKKGLSFPLHLLRGPIAAGLSNTVNAEIKIIADPKFQLQVPVPNFGVGVGSVHGTMSTSYIIKPPQEWRSVAHEEVDRLEARGKMEKESDVDDFDEDDDFVDDDDGFSTDDPNCDWKDYSDDEDYESDSDKKRKNK